MFSLRKVLATGVMLALFPVVAQTGTAAPTQPATAPTCGTQPVTLNAYFETGFDLPFKLSDEFTKEYPNVTWNISQDQFANLIRYRAGNRSRALLSGNTCREHDGPNSHSRCLPPKIQENSHLHTPPRRLNRTED